MAARQEVRLKEAEAADQKEAANRDTFAEPTRALSAPEAEKSRPNRHSHCIAATVLSKQSAKKASKVALLIYENLLAIHRSHAQKIMHCRGSAAVHECVSFGCDA
jgi:hypothetical protein